MYISTLRGKHSKLFHKEIITTTVPKLLRKQGLAHKGLTPNMHCSDSVGHVASFSYLKCPHHARKLLIATVPMSLYSLIINFIFHCKTVNKMGKWGARE